MVHGAPTRRASMPTNITNNNNTEQQNYRTEKTGETLEPAVAPDGGWGWMVVFGSFMIHIITDGMTYSFGLFYNEFLNYFNEGKGYTAWIASIMVGVTFASGPISSSFVNRYGCRAVTISGAILAAACIAASMFAQNVLTLIFTIGLGTGLGFGLIYLPAIVSVSTWFEAKRSLATGIAVCGSGFGTFIFAPLTDHLISNFGWRGALLIIGGIVLNCIIFGAMFRPLPQSDTSQKPAKKKSLVDDNTTAGELLPLKPNQKLNDKYTQLNLEGMNSMGQQSKVEQANALEKAANNHKDHKEINTTGKSASNENITSSNTSQPNTLKANQRQHSRSSLHRSELLTQGSQRNISEKCVIAADNSNSAIMMGRCGSKNQSNLQLNQQIPQNDRTFCGCFTCSEDTRNTLAEMMNFSLLKDIIFIIFAISNFCTSIGFNMPYIYIVAKAEAINLTSEQSSYMIAIIGVANTVARIIFGYVCDKPWVNRLWMYNISLTICGIATAVCPLCSGMNSLSLYCAVFGFTIGAYVGLTSVILVDLLGLEKLTNAFGLLLLFQGVASFIGPPIGGWLYDITLSYDPAFLLAGIMIAISGLVMFFIPPIQKYQAKKAKNPSPS